MIYIIPLCSEPTDKKLPLPSMVLVFKTLESRIFAPVYKPLFLLRQRW